MKRINIIAWHNGGGLSRDIDTLIDALPADRFEVTVNGVPRQQASIHRRRIVHRISNICHRWLHRSALAAAPFDVNLFLEDISPGFFRYAKANMFIPNPEWFKANQHRHLGGIDTVLCKSRDAQDTFSRLQCNTRFIGFTSEDRGDRTGATAPENTFFHMAGRSWQKGTAALVALWLRHPEWPVLTVVQNARTYSQAKVQPVVAPNIRHLLTRLDDAELQQLQNRHAIHLCPSEAEGFGHCIAEAMSCGALTLTTDAPPMNELITPERGVLVQYHRTRRQRAGVNYYVDPVDLERKIQHILALDAPARQALGDSARQWFQENDRLFRRRLIEALEPPPAAP
ncbi:MAG: glycosyltransferase family 4 protein [Halioglobus sp.]|nr:glycosyltransferase family 4 protein [Halioglobus sp.]